jgi:hypothetical protein
LQQTWQIFKGKTFATSVANFQKQNLCNKRGKFSNEKPMQQAWQFCTLFKSKTYATLQVWDILKQLDRSSMFEEFRDLQYINSVLESFRI